MKQSTSRITFYIAWLLLLLIGCTDSNTDNVTNKVDFNDQNSRIDARVDSLLQLMTLEEKIGQMNQYNGFMDFTGPVPDGDDTELKFEHIKKGYVGSMLNVKGVEEIRAVQRIAVEESRLGIPLIFGYDVIHGYKTMSPIPLAEAASWDLKAIENSARLAAKEASAAGINWTFAPMVDISRDARWGRVMEGAGEDPYLGSLIAKARIKGFQGEDLSSRESIIACAKHFAAYGFPEGGREYNNADLGTSTLYNVVLPPFKAANEAGVKTFMNSFNQLNGIPATANDFLLRDILKDEWKFKGFVVSDWGSVAELVPHGYAPDGRTAAQLAVNAGTDMDMESSLYVSELLDLVNDNKVDLATIDEAVKRILKVKFELGLFDDPYKYCSEELEKEVIGSQELTDGALDMALKSVVLLKNENKLLPLDKSNKNIVLIGPLAADKDSPLGNWRAMAVDNSAISVLEGMQEYNQDIIYSRGPELITAPTEFSKEVKINETDTTGLQEAIQVARNADVVVMVLGEHGLQSGEGRSRTQIDLPGLQQQLLEEIYKVNRNIVLILNNGRPLALPWAKENVPAIVEAWHLGSQSGNAIAKILYGDYNPSGKLPMTFPRSVGQVPIYYNDKSTGRPSLPSKDFVFWSHYQDVSNEPLWPFGYGLSYTEFKYTNFKIENNFDQGKYITVSIDIENTGDVAGKDVVQLYLKDRFSKVVRPMKELKAFQQIFLQPNENKTIVFKLSKLDFSYYDNNGKLFYEDGVFDISIGNSSNPEFSSSMEMIF